MKDNREVGEELLRDMFARCVHAHPEALAASTVLLVGAGSVGSYIAEQLVRSGLGRLIVVDHEQVEVANLSRTIYELGDVGAFKTDALRRRLTAINPFVRVECLAFRLQDLPEASLRTLFMEADVIIGATDDSCCQSRINHVSYWLDKPSIYFGIYAKAEGGEIVLVVPGVTKCFSCATLSSRALRTGTQIDLNPSLDYETGRLMAVAGLAADIQHVCSAGVKIIVSLLALLHGQNDSSGFLTRALYSRMTYILFGMTNDFWFFPSIFADTRAQHAFQSIWMIPEGQEDCPICGAVASRTDPFKIDKAISVNVLRERFSQEL